MLKPFFWYFKERKLSQESYQPYKSFYLKNNRRERESYIKINNENQTPIKTCH